MVKNQGEFRILSSIASETVTRQRQERQKKVRFCDNFFYFQIFVTFRKNSEIDFSINLNKCS